MTAINFFLTLEEILMGGLELQAPGHLFPDNAIEMSVRMAKERMAIAAANK